MPGTRGGKRFFGFRRFGKEVIRPLDDIVNDPRMESFRARLLAELPKSKQGISGGMLSFAYRAKGMIKELAVINFEIAQMTVAADGAEALPDWFMMEIIRDLPRLVG